MLTCEAEQKSCQKGRKFDINFWKARVENRMARSVAKGVLEFVAMKQYLVDMSCVRDISKLIGWCDRRALTVYFKRHENGTYDSNFKSIMISANASPAKQVIYLLHECGHHLIQQHPGSHNRFDMGYNQTDPAITSKFPSRLACLEEEIEAWQRGRNLAKKLKLRIDDRTLDDVRINCLKSYVKWTINKKDYK